MSKVFRALIVLIIIAFFCVAPFAFLYFTNSKIITYKEETKIWYNTSSEDLSHLYDEQTVTLLDSDHYTTYTYNDLDIYIVWTNQQLELLNQLYVNLDDMSFQFKYSNKFKDVIHSLNDERNEWVSALFIETDTDFDIRPEQMGNLLDIEAIEGYVKQNFDRSGIVVKLHDYQMPQPDNWITSEAYLAEKEKWDNFSIQYTNGFTIVNEMVKDCFKLENDIIVFDEEMSEILKERVANWVYEDLQNYTTLGGVFLFTTHDGEIVEVPGVNYGDIYNPQAEIPILYEKIVSYTASENNIPVMKKDMNDDIQNNVIEISIDKQHLWKWTDGVVTSETDIVTGWKNKWDTPRGVYQILNVIDGVYLEGADYKTWVDKWMRIWNGYGLHDATWRNKFGGDIYTRDGSHGCINLPHKFAVQLYDEVGPGYVVVIY